MYILQNKNRVEVNDVSAYWNCREGQELYSHYSETAALVRPTCSQCMECRFTHTISFFKEKMQGYPYQEAVGYDYCEGL